MIPVGVLTILLAVGSIGATVFVCFAKEGLRLPAWIILGTFYVGFMVSLLVWCNEIYAEGNLPLARSTFAVGGVLFGVILLAPIIRKNKVATWIAMTAFLLLVIAFIILSVYLSKTVIQPNAPLD